MGNATQKLAPEDISALNGMEDVTGMDRKELMKEYKKFKKQYPTGGISKESFRKVCEACLEDVNEDFVGEDANCCCFVLFQLADQFLPPQQRTGEFITRLFNAFDADKSGEIDFREFLIAMNYALSDQPDEKISFYFKTLDLDNSGFLEEKEVRYAVELIFKVRSARNARDQCKRTFLRLLPALCTS